jgi:hypothetical protein
MIVKSLRNPTLGSEILDIRSRRYTNVFLSSGLGDESTVAEKRNPTSNTLSNNFCAGFYIVKTSRASRSVLVSMMCVNLDTGSMSKHNLVGDAGDAQSEIQIRILDSYLFLFVLRSHFCSNYRAFFANMLLHQYTRCNMRYLNLIILY